MARPKKSDNALDLDRMIEKFIVEPNTKVNLDKQYKTRVDLGDTTKEELGKLLYQGVLDLASEQDKLYAESSYGLLVIIQAMDAAGKDSTIKHVFTGVNPQGCDVHSFKAPSTEELSHDYLWRCAKAVPERGKIGIFNRSYYEEVLITRVHQDILKNQKLPSDLVDKQIWSRRYQEMNNFEEYLVNNGIVVLKLFLNVSKEEQKKRFLARIDRKDKNWKFSADDARDRNLWDKYREAYEDCFSKTSTKWAPWYVIPADHKPFTRLAVAQLMVSTLLKLKLNYPRVSKAQQEELQQVKVLLENERA